MAPANGDGKREGGNGFQIQGRTGTDTAKLVQRPIWGSGGRTVGGRTCLITHMLCSKLNFGLTLLSLYIQPSTFPLHHYLHHRRRLLQSTYSSSSVANLLRWAKDADPLTW